MNGDEILQLCSLMDVLIDFKELSQIFVPAKKKLFSIRLKICSLMKLTTFSRCSMVILLAGLDFIQMMQSTQVPELFGTLRMCAMSVTLSCFVSRSLTLIPTVVLKIDSAIQLIYPSTHWKSIRETSCLEQKKDIYTGQHYPPFEQLGPDCKTSLSYTCFYFKWAIYQIELSEQIPVHAKPSPVYPVEQRHLQEPREFVQTAFW